MDTGLTDKTAFVSGSTQGIGYAIARALAAEGARVIMNGRDPGRLGLAVRRLQEEEPGAHVSGLAADFADPSQVSELLAALGDVDVLVNNVGVFEVKDFAGITDDAWQTFFDINVMSGVRLSRQVLPRMLARGSGRIVFIASESGVDVPADMMHYGATKAAMLALSSGLAKLTRGTGVTVNSVLGGPTYSDGVAQAVAEIAAMQEVDVEILKSAIVASRPGLLERFIGPSEIANLVVYLASPLSSATNGAAVRADGGVLTTVL